MSLVGIDISNHQQNIRLLELPGSVVLLKATEGKGFIDKMFSIRARELKDSDKFTGYYHFSWVKNATSENTPKQEFDNFARTVTPFFRVTTPLINDWEPSYRDTNKRLEWALEWEALCKAEFGVIPWRYCQSSVANYDWPDKGTVPLWVASYGPPLPKGRVVNGYQTFPLPGLPGYKNVVGFQYTQRGKLEGFSGELDLNEFYLSVNQWRLGIWNVNTPVAVEPVTPGMKGEMHNIGQRLTSGRNAMGCIHMRDWYPLFKRMGIKRGLIKKEWDITQAQGGYSKSGGTHKEGTALDLLQYSPAVSELARECGAPAAWPRGPQHGMINHTHLAIDCPCWSGADYQIAEVKDGGDGLKGNKKDYIRRPTRWRNHSQGIAYMKSQLAGEPLGDNQANPGGWDPFSHLTKNAGKNPDGVVLYGISDENLEKALVGAGFDPEWYGGNLAITLSDFAFSIAIPQTDVEIISRLTDVLEGRHVPSVLVDHRVQFEAAINGGYSPNVARPASIHAVRAIQSGLANSGYSPGPEDGMYGDVTMNAVRRWQDDRYFGGDGIVGKNDARSICLMSSPQPEGVRVSHVY